MRTPTPDPNDDNDAEITMACASMLREAGAAARAAVAFLEAAGCRRADGTFPPISVPLLFKLGLAVRLCTWESAAVVPSSFGLPASHELLADVFRPADQQRYTAAALQHQFMKFWRRGLAWPALPNCGVSAGLVVPAVNDANAAESRSAFLDALATFLWKLRHLGSSPAAVESNSHEEGCAA